MTAIQESAGPRDAQFTLHGLHRGTVAHRAVSVLPRFADRLFGRAGLHRELPPSVSNQKLAFSLLAGYKF